MKRVACGFLAAAASAALSAWAAGTVPGQIHYQGRLVRDGVPVNETLPMEFHLYDALQGGSELFSETQTVSVVGGDYAIYIGASRPLAPELFRDHDLTYLEVHVGGEALAPRDRIVAVAYAFQAQYAQEATVAHRLAQDEGTAVTGPTPAPAHVGSTVNVAFLAHLNSTNQFIGTNGEEVVDWRAVEYDTDGDFDPMSDRFTAPVDGYYRLSTQVTFRGGKDSKLAWVTLKHGTNYISKYTHRMVGAGTFSMFTSRDVFLPAGDYATVYVGQLSGATQEVAGLPWFTYFSGYLMQQP